MTAPLVTSARSSGSDRRAHLILNGILALVVVIGIVAVASYLGSSSTSRGAVLGATATAVVSTAGGAGAATPAAAPTPTPRVPSAGASALRLSITVNDRLAASAEKLRAGAPGASDPVAIAATLRSIAADAAWGLDVVSRLGEWPAAADLQGTLRAYYTSVVEAAGDGLNATITSAAAYRDAAQRMLALTARLPELRATSVDLALANGIALPKP